MARYLMLYWALIKNNLSRELQFRADFWMSVFSRLVWFLMFVVFFRLIFRHTALINGWGYYQVLMLVGVFNLLETTLFVFFISNFSRMPQYISDGELDFLLLKPVDTQFLISLRFFSFASVLNIFPPLALIGIAWHNIGLNFSFIGAAVFLAAFCLSMIILYSLWFITVVSLFWLNKIYEIHELFLASFRFMQYPSSVYHGAARYFFTFIFPIILTVSVPTEALLGSLQNKQALLFLAILAVLLLSLSRVIWRLGVRRYASASS